MQQLFRRTADDDHDYTEAYVTNIGHRAFRMEFPKHKVLYDPHALFCERCGARMERRFIPEEGKERDACPSCGYIRYFNPTPIVVAIIEHKGKVLLAKRAIDPRKGFWTLPGGFQELHETLAEGAARESWEEAGAKISIQQLYIAYDIPFAGQATFAFIAHLESEDFSPGPESLDVRLFTEEEIPWDELSFRTVSIALRHFFADRKTGIFPVRSILLEQPENP